MSLALHAADARTPHAPHSVGGRVRRTGLAVFFVSIAINAVLAIYALVSPGFGATQGKILGSSMCVTGAILLALACEPAWERGLIGPVPYVGALTGAAGFALAIGGIWTHPKSEVYGRVLGSVFAVAVACTIASLLALTTLSPSHRWVRRVAFALLAVGASMYGAVFWLGDDPSTVYLRAMGIVLVAFAAFAVSVPVLHWIDRAAVAARESSDAVRYCPHCGRKLAGAIGAELTCGRCGRGFSVSRIEANLT